MVKLETANTLTPKVALHLISLANFKDQFGKERYGLPLLFGLFSAINIDCIAVSTLPVKSAIDDHIQQLFDALLQSLRHSIMTNVQTIDAFPTDAKKSLSVRPQSVEEIGEVNKKHAEITKQKPQVGLDMREEHILRLHVTGIGKYMVIGNKGVEREFKDMEFALWENRGSCEGQAIISYASADGYAHIDRTYTFGLVQYLIYFSIGSSLYPFPPSF